MKPLTEKASLLDPELFAMVEGYLQRAVARDELVVATEMNARAVLIILRLLRHAENPGLQASRLRGALAAWQVKRVVRLIEERVARAPSLAELASAIGLSQFHFARAFKVSTGLPPHRWIQLHRVEIAKRLLSQPETSITDVAACVGYENPGHFAKVFRSATGTTPRSYRRTHAVSRQS